MRGLALTCLVVGLAPAAQGAETAGRAEVYAFEGTDLDGRRFALKDLRGKVVVVSFWATWCVPCKKALPVLDALRTKHGDKLEVVAVSIDDTSTRSRVRGTVKRYRWKMPVVVDENGDIGSAINPRGLAPYTLFVDHTGRLAHEQEGFSKGDDAKFGERITQLLAALDADVKDAAPAKP